MQEIEEAKKRAEEEKKKKEITKAKSVDNFVEKLMKENKQFKCVRCKGKNKDNAISLVTTDAIYVLIKDSNGIYQMKEQVFMSTVTQIAKIKKVPGQIRIKFIEEEKEKHISLNLDNLDDEFIEEIGNKAN